MEIFKGMDEEQVEICEKAINKYGELVFVANELCRVLNWNSEDAGYTDNEFASILVFDKKGHIDSIHIFNSKLGVAADAFRPINKENNIMLLDIYYDWDAERFCVQFRNYKETDFVFDSYCCEKLRELLLVMDGALQKKEVKECKE